MISPYAIAEIEDLEKAGFHLTPADIIRLNAIGLKVDHGVDDNPLYLARRCAFVADVILKEPTIAHSIFFAELMRFFDVGDTVTRTCLWAWLLTLEEPPHATPTAAGVRETLSHFIEEHYRQTTFTQLTMAVNFCLYGYDSAALERPVRAPVEDPDAEPTADDTALADAWSFEIGLVHEAEALGLGISLADARTHTRAQLHAIVHRAIRQRYAFADPKGGSAAYRAAMKNKFITEFQNTLDAIRERLEAERKGNG